jgi:hypothetical protein
MMIFSWFGDVIEKSSERNFLPRGGAVEGGVGHGEEGWVDRWSFVYFAKSVVLSHG